MPCTEEPAPRRGFNEGSGAGRRNARRGLQEQTANGQPVNTDWRPDYSCGGLLKYLRGFVVKFFGALQARDAEDDIPFW
jgi:hypothetical protein